ncbi:FAD-binding domain-containing protein [Exidia glandulosa HHB12029]|uniref:FAD-binding domain-containing protein n=1 Tax=Exidia glandulosa HHB12029 TaxID=1314781 RepID=A0A165NQZ1_EXIGL|nr:FAD-binding domain-containing protein [Exidia glandulosa HHB12029]
MLLLTAVACLLNTVVAAGGLQSCLHTRLSPASTLVSPSSAEYPNATVSNNLSWQYFASAVVFVGSAEDAAIAVKCAAASKIPVTPRGGRHSYASFGSGGRNGSFVVDVTRLQSFSYDPKTTYATVGAGFRLGNLALALDAHGRATPHGTCTFVGIGGHATCGGYGLTSRLWGLLVDQIVRVTAVTAAGDVVEASPSKHSDLLWAISGAAPSFAVVLSFTIRTYPQPASTSYFDFDFGNFSDTPSLAVKALLAFQSFAATSAPPELGTQFTVGRSAGGTLGLRLSGVYYGVETAIPTVIQPLLDAIPFSPISNTSKLQGYMASVAFLGGDDPVNTTGRVESPNTAYEKSIIVPTSAPLSEETWTKFVEFAFNTPVPPGISSYYWQIDAFGGSYRGKRTAMAAFPSDANAFGGRDGLLLMQHGTYSDTSGSYPAGGHAFANSFAGTITETVRTEGKKIEAYQCYVDPLLSADEAHALYFGHEKTHKLKALKHKWDPARVFDYPHAF